MERNIVIKQLQNDFTTLEQSKRLLELGVPVKSADCYYCIINATIQQGIEVICDSDIFFDINTYLKDFFPCWSLGRLVEIYVIARGLDTAYLPVEKDEDMVKYLVRLYEEKIKDLDFSKLED